MVRHEIWVLDGYATATATDTAFPVPVLEQNRFRQITPEMTKRKLYAGFVAPGCLLNRLFVEFIFRRLGSEVARVPFYLRGADTNTTAPAIARPAFAPALPFTVQAAASYFDYPPAGSQVADSRSWQTFDISGNSTPAEMLTMFPTPMNLEADTVECVGAISVASISGNPLRLVWGIVSEFP